MELVGEENRARFSIRHFGISNENVSFFSPSTAAVELLVFPQSNKSHQVSQFHITNWAPDGSCSKINTMTDVIDEVGKVQRKTGNHPIITHCR